MRRDNVESLFESVAMTAANGGSSGGMAVVVCGPGVYDKRALTVSDPLSLCHSLGALAALSAAAPTQLAAAALSDGGLCRLVRLLSKHLSSVICPSVDRPITSLLMTTTDRRSLSACLAILSNLTVRGSAGTRYFLFQAGIVKPLAELLKETLKAMEALPRLSAMSKGHGASVAETDSAATVKDEEEEGEQEQRTTVASIQELLQEQEQETGQPMEDVAMERESFLRIRTDLTNGLGETLLMMTPGGPLGPETPEAVETGRTTGLLLQEPLGNTGRLVGTTPEETQEDALSHQQQAQPTQQHHIQPPRPRQLRARTGLDTPTLNLPDPLETLAFLLDNVHAAIRIVAFLSKYPDLRIELHHRFAPDNLFALVEPFTLAHLSNPKLAKMAASCMKNAFRKDPEVKHPLKRCANLKCDRVESKYHEFFKCSRCCRVVYCGCVFCVFSHV